MTNPPPTHVAGWFSGHHAVNPVVDGIGINKTLLTLCIPLGEFYFKGDFYFDCYFT